MIPLFSVMIRIAVYLSIGIIVLIFFSKLGAPAIALAEIAIILEAVILWVWLRKKVHSLDVNWSSIVRGVFAAVISGAVTYAAAVFLPGPGYLTSIIGMVLGLFCAIPVILPEIRLLFNL